MLGPDFWERYFLVYDHLNELLPYQELLRVIISALDLKHGERVLDAGSGTGNISVLIERAGAVPVGFDSSAAGVSIHRRKQPHIFIVEGSLTDSLPFSDNSFDKICINNVIYTLPKSLRRGVFCELRRVLKPGGRIVISNLAEGFAPFHIYNCHIRSSIRRYGFFRTVGRLCRLLIPTVRIFYYNYRIEREHVRQKGSFMVGNEQRELLIESGFRQVSETRRVYSGQAVLNIAYKK